jgi:hypothetical protein
VSAGGGRRERRRRARRGVGRAAERLVRRPDGVLRLAHRARPRRAGRARRAHDRRRDTAGGHRGPSGWRARARDGGSLAGGSRRPPGPEEPTAPWPGTTKPPRGQSPALPGVVDGFRCDSGRSFRVVSGLRWGSICVRSSISHPWCSLGVEVARFPASPGHVSVVGLSDGPPRDSSSPTATSWTARAGARLGLVRIRHTASSVASPSALGPKSPVDSPRHRCRWSRPSSPGSSVLSWGPLSRVSPAASGPACSSFVPSVARGLAPCLHAREQTPFSEGFGREAAKPLRSFRPRGSVPPRRLAPLPASDMLQSAPGLGFTRLAPGRPSALATGSEEPVSSAVGSGPEGPSRSSLRRFESRSVSGPRHRGCRSPPAVPPSDASSSPLFRGSSRCAGRARGRSLSPLLDLSAGLPAGSRFVPRRGRPLRVVRVRPFPSDPAFLRGLAVTPAAPLPCTSHGRFRRGPGGSGASRLPGLHRPSGSVRVDSPSFLGLATSGCRLWTPDHPPARGENSRSRRPGRLRLLEISHQGLVRIRALRLPLPPSQATG